MKRLAVVTIQDVAREAGVSPASVSNAFHGRTARLSEATRERILDAAARLDYTPNAVAASLRSRRSQTIGVVVTNIVNPFYSAVVRSIQDAARQHGYSVILGNTDDDPAEERKILTVLGARQVDGILLVTAGGNEDLIRRVRDNGLPVVLFDRGDASLELDTVTVDNEAASERAVRTLIGMGHRRIALLSGLATGVATRAARLRGYQLALEKAGLPCRPEYVKMARTASGPGCHAVHELLSLAEPPTALFVTNTFLAVGALEALQSRGVRIPGELSFLMFDDPDWARLFTPPISAIRQPAAEIGGRAFGLLEERLSRRKDAARAVVLETALELRGSAGPAPANSE